MRRVVRFFDALLIAFIVLLVATAAFFLLRHERFLGTTPRVLALVAVPLVLAMALGATFRLRGEVRAGLTMLLTFVVVTLYGVELFLVLDPVGRVIGAVQARDIPSHFDQRSALEVVADLQAEGRDAYPRVWTHRWVLDPLIVAGEPVIPVSGIAETTTVACNESGQYMIYESDPLGFNNPPEVWEEESHEVALLGDSFVQGECVPPEAGMASVIRGRHPTTLNLGFSSNGPLLQLAGLREYLALTEPRDVVWFFYGGNDISQDLTGERKNPLLRRYLADPSFTQELKPRSEEIDRAMRARVDELLREAHGPPLREGKTAPVSLAERLERTVKLWELRARLGLLLDEEAGGSPRDLSEAEIQGLWGLYERIVASAKETVEGWGGSLWLVFLPGQHDLESATTPAFHEEFLALGRHLDLQVIDLYPEFERHPDQASLFPPLVPPIVTAVHYSEVGHRLVGEAVIAALGQSRVR